MKKHLLLTLLAALALSVSAGALEYTMEAPDTPNYGKASSIEVVHTRDNGERKNADVSKNAALIPPGFGTPTADLPGSGEYLTPNLAPEAKAGVGAAVNGSMSSAAVLPPSSGSAVFAPSGGNAAAAPPSGNSGSVYQPGSSSLTTTTKPTAADASTFTSVTEDLYYKGGYLGRLEIPTIDLSVKVYQGENWVPEAPLLPRALDTLRKPPSGAATSASPHTTGGPTTTSARSTPWTPETRTPSPPNWGPRPTR